MRIEELFLAPLLLPPTAPSLYIFRSCVYWLILRKAELTSFFYALYDKAVIVEEDGARDVVDCRVGQMQVKRWQVQHSR